MKLKLNTKSLLLLLLLIVFVVVVVVVKVEHLESVESSRVYKYKADGTKEFLDPINAKEACQVIASRVEEIEAEWGGKAEFAKQIGKINPFNRLFSFADPESYRSGENKTKTITRNVINTDLSVEDRKVINDRCDMISASTQENIISVNTNDCPYCIDVIKLKADLALANKDPSIISECTIRNVNQSNRNLSKQTCMIKTSIEILREKKNSVDAQALAEVLQKAQNPISGSNASLTENCNVVSTDMSSKSYFEKNFTCNELAKSDQKNAITGCSAFQDIVQTNSNRQYQECMNEMAEKSQEKTEQDVLAKITTTVKQYTEGVSPLAMMSCSLSCLLSSIIPSVVLAYIATDPNVQQTIRDMS